MNLNEKNFYEFLNKAILLHNNNQRFVCKNTFLKPVSNSAAISIDLKNSSYKIPIAHGEGRFFTDEDTLKSLEDNDQILFQYCDEGGLVTNESNPNGSLNNIAGITNKGKNVFGMMPHPERASDRFLSNEDGLFLFNSLLKNCTKLYFGCTIYCTRKCRNSKFWQKHSSFLKRFQ